jgi:hypothetical protein
MTNVIEQDGQNVLEGYVETSNTQTKVFTNMQALLDYVLIFKLKHFDVRTKMGGGTDIPEGESLMNTLTHEERIQALSKILNALQEAATQQTDKEFKEFGARNIFEAIQLAKRMIYTAEFESSIAEADALDVSLGISNIQ